MKGVEDLMALNVTARELASQSDGSPWSQPPGCQPVSTEAKVSSRTEIELAARVFQISAPSSAASDLSLSADRG